MTHSYKHTILLGALITGMLAVSAGVGVEHVDSTLGTKAPVVQLGGVQSAINADELRGKYVLITFWSSFDAASREACNRYNAWFNSHHPADARFVGINFDDSPSMFNEIVRRDSLTASDQYHVSAAEAKAIYDTYRLDRGFGSLLVSPQGRIVSYNPTVEQLSAVI